MILPDHELRKWASGGGISPYCEECINPASVDLRWSGNVRIATPAGWTDVRECDEIELLPGCLYLMDTMEYLCIPTDCSGELVLKSSMGRVGLEHLHSGYFDPAFTGTGTLEMHVMAPWTIRLVKGQRIVQMILHRLESHPERDYSVTGRYVGQTGPTPARSA